MSSKMEVILQTARQLRARFSPERLLLFSRRTDLAGETASFKLCMVADVQDKRAAQREIFAQAQEGPPFEVLIYTPREWAAARERAGSFAQRVEQMGRELPG